MDQPSLIKMYCIFSKESIHAMDNNPGKMAAQAGHAYLHSWWNCIELIQYMGREADKGSPSANRDYQRLANTMNDYREGDDARKICLVVNTTEELRQLVEDYKGFTGTTLVEDAGYTITTPGTITCAGIGPLRDSEKGSDLASLALLK